MPEAPKKKARRFPRPRDQAFIAIDHPRNFNHPIAIRKHSEGQEKVWEARGGDGTTWKKHCRGDFFQWIAERLGSLVRRLPVDRRCVEEL